MTPVVDVLGNIYVHTKAGVRIPIQDQDESGLPISLVGVTWTFEAPGISKALIVDEGDVGGLILEITAAEAASLPKGQASPFIVLDEHGDERWSGMIHRRGW